MSNTSTRPSVLHVIVRAGATNSQYNEHCLPMRDERDITVCSLFPADVTPPISIRLVEGDGTARGGARALRRALALGTYDIVHVHAPASGVLTLWVYLTGRRRRRNLVFTVHNSWANFRRRNRAFLYLILALFPTVVVCGKAAADSMPRLLRRLVRRKLDVVQNGVDVDRIDTVLAGLSDDDRSEDREGPRVVSVNRLIPLKDPATVLNAFVRARTPGSLTFIGDGPLRTRLATDVLQSGLQEQVAFTGIIERDRVYSMLADADLFVTASRGEGLPVGVLEAMACACPVLLTDIPPHREIAALAHEVPLVPPGDVAGLARAMRRVLALEPSERRELGHRQRQSVIEHFSVRAMNKAYGEIYMTVIERNRGRRRTPQLVGNGGPAAEDEEGDGLLTRMQRRLRLVVALVLIGGLGGYAYAQLQQPEYQAHSSLLVGDVIGGPADESALKAAAGLAASYADLVRREPVLEPVAEQGFAEDWRQLQPRVHAQTGDKNPQLVQITASAPQRRGAEGLAGAVSEQLVALTADRLADEQAEFAARQLSRQEAQILTTQSRIETLQARIDRQPNSPRAQTLTSEVDDLRVQLATLQSQYDEMVGEPGDIPATADVRVLEHAYAAPSALRPDTLALVAAGAGVGFAVAAGWIYLMGRRRPRGAPGHGSAQHRGPVNGHDHGPRPMRPDPWTDHDSYVETPRRESKGR